MNETFEYELDTAQCVKVSLYMYAQWQEAMKPPLLIYNDFPTWLKKLEALNQSTKGEQ